MNRRTFLRARSTVDYTLACATPLAAQEKIGGEINILSWGNYIDFALKPFEEKYGVKINIDYYGDEQEAMNKIRAAGLGTHDIVFLGAGFEDIAMKQSLIIPLDISNISSYADLFPVLQKKKPDGNVYCATYSFGLNGIIAYDPAKTGGPITSWKDVYSGRLHRPNWQDRQIERAGLANGPKSWLHLWPAFR